MPRYFVSYHYSGPEVTGKGYSVLESAPITSAEELGRLVGRIAKQLPRGTTVIPLYWRRMERPDRRRK